MYDTFGFVSVEVDGKIQNFVGLSSGIMEYEVGKTYLVIKSFRPEDLQNKYKDSNYIPVINQNEVTYYINDSKRLQYEVKEKINFKDRRNLRSASFIPLDEVDISELKEFIIKYEESNDTQNFYERSYK